MKITANVGDLNKMIQTRLHEVPSVHRHRVQNPSVPLKVRPVLKLSNEGGANWDLRWDDYDEFFVGDLKKVVARLREQYELREEPTLGADDVIVLQFLADCVVAIGPAVATSSDLLAYGYVSLAHDGTQTITAKGREWLAAWPRS